LAKAAVQHSVGKPYRWINMMTLRVEAQIRAHAAPVSAAEESRIHRDNFRFDRN